MCVALYSSAFPQKKHVGIILWTYFLMMVTSPCGPNLMMELGVWGLCSWRREKHT